MESLLVLVILAVLAIPVAVIYLLVATSRMRRQVTELDDRLTLLARDLRGGTIAVPSDDPSPDPQATTAPKSDPITSSDVEPEPDSQHLPSPWPSAPREETDDRASPTQSAGEPQSPPRAVVFRAEKIEALTAWLKENWFLAVAALSLVLAGVFLVQYGIENGLLTPFWRVAGAVALGLALLAAGEVLRRRFGDEDANTAFMPSTFSGAGLVVLYAAVLSAHHLYSMISGGATFFWLAGIAAASIALGWFYGPFLTLVGILGAIIAPFLVGGSSDTPELFYGYFALVALAALVVDAVRRWAYVSVLGLAGAFAAASYIFVLGVGDLPYLGFALVMAIAAVVLPPLKLTPSHGGSLVVEALLPRSQTPRQWPEFPTRLAFGAIFAASGSGLLVMVVDPGEVEVWLALATVMLIFGLVVHWSFGAEALSDAALAAPGVLLALIFWQAADYGSLYAGFQPGVEETSDPGMRTQASMLAGAGAILSVLAMWRALGPGRLGKVWAGGAAMAAPLAVLALEVLWGPAHVLGDYPWALHAMAIAALMVLGATIVARRDGPARERPAYFALAASVMIAFAMVVLYSETALTLAIAVLVLGAAYIDRRFDLRLLLVAVVAGSVAIGWRLVILPGVVWSENAPMWEVILVHAGSIAALALSWLVLGARQRWQAQIMVASTAWMAGGVFGAVLLYRWLGSEAESHWGLTLMALVWLGSAAVQAWRLKIGGGWIARVRTALAITFALIAAVFFAFALYQNPLTTPDEPVLGLWLFNTLLVAYLLPAICLAGIAWKFSHVPPRVRMVTGGLAAVLAATYTGLAIRHIWQGADLSVPGVKSGELYSYTLALLLGSVGLLFLAFIRRSELLRKVAIAGVALTIAKVFLIDMSGLTGLTRVASFLGLGLSLAGLAWVVRVMNAQWVRKED